MNPADNYEMSSGTFMSTEYPHHHHSSGYANPLGGGYRQGVAHHNHHNTSNYRMYNNNSRKEYEEVSSINYSGEADGPVWSGGYGQDGGNIGGSSCWPTAAGNVGYGSNPALHRGSDKWMDWTLGIDQHANIPSPGNNNNNNSSSFEPYGVNSNRFSHHGSSLSLTGFGDHEATNGNGMSTMPTVQQYDVMSNGHSKPVPSLGSDHVYANNSKFNDVLISRKDPDLVRGHDTAGSAAGYPSVSDRNEAILSFSNQINQLLRYKTTQSLSPRESGNYQNDKSDAGKSSSITSDHLPSGGISNNGAGNYESADALCRSHTTQSKNNTDGYALQQRGDDFTTAGSQVSKSSVPPATFSDNCSYSNGQQTLTSTNGSLRSSSLKPYEIQKTAGFDSRDKHPTQYELSCDSLVGSLGQKIDAYDALKMPWESHNRRPPNTVNEPDEYRQVSDHHACINQRAASFRQRQLISNQVNPPGMNISNINNSSLTSNNVGTISAANYDRLAHQTGHYGGSYQTLGSMACDPSKTMGFHQNHHIHSVNGPQLYITPVSNIAASFGSNDMLNGQTTPSTTRPYHPPYEMHTIGGLGNSMRNHQQHNSLMMMKTVTMQSTQSLNAGRKKKTVVEQIAERVMKGILRMVCEEVDQSRTRIDVGVGTSDDHDMQINMCRELMQVLNISSMETME